MNRIFLLVIWLCVLASCEKQIPLKQFKFEEKLVLNCYNDVNSELSFWLSKSVNTTEVPELNNLNGFTTILVKEDSTAIYYDDAEVVDGLVVLPIHIKPGFDYSIQLQFEEFPTIAAVDHSPSHKPQFSILSADEHGDYYRVKIELYDSESTSKFLLQTYLKQIDTSSGNSILLEEDVKFSSGDEVFVSSINTLSSKSAFGIFEDNLFQNSSRIIELSIAKKEFNTSCIDKKIKVKISSVSDIMFNYYIGLLQNNHIYGGPLATYTLDNGNVYNGLGVFGLYASQSDTINVN